MPKSSYQVYMQNIVGLAQAVGAVQGAEGTEGMGMTGMMDVMLIVLYIGCGFYSIYSYFAQRKMTTVLENKIICPNNCEPKKCKNPQAFLQFILPRMLILGIGLVVLGGLFLLDHFYGNNDPLLTVLLMILPLVLFVWYVLEQRKAAQRFWRM